MKNRPLRIAVNALSVRTGGAVACLLGLLPELEKEGKVYQHQYVVVISRSQGEILSDIPPSLERIALPLDSANVLLRLLFEQVLLPFVLWFKKIDVLYSLGNTTSVLAPCKIVLLMENSHPYSQLNLPWPLPFKLKNILLRILGDLSMVRADKIRFVSLDSQKGITGLFRISRDKKVVIPHGLSFGRLKANGYTGRPFEFRYILNISHFGPHKNLERLMDAFDQFVETCGYKGNLVIIGKPTSVNYAQKLKKYRMKLRHPERVIWTGEVPWNDIFKFYKFADAFIFPSLEETFGVPILEAMAMGVPTAASDCRGLLVDHFNPFYEIGGEAIHYFNPYNVEEIAQAMQRLTQDSSYRESLVRKGYKCAACHKWDYVARKLSALFNKVAVIK